MDQRLKEYLERTLKEVSIDCVIFGFHEEELKVLLLKWKGMETKNERRNYCQFHQRYSTAFWIFAAVAVLGYKWVVQGIC